MFFLHAGICKRQVNLLSYDFMLKEDIRRRLSIESRKAND